jgi:hypothetical protein
MEKTQPPHITRREFLKLAGLNLGALLASPRLLSLQPSALWPFLTIDQLPPAIADIINRTAQSWIDSSGYLTLKAANGGQPGRVPLSPTQWNQERRGPRDRLISGIQWGIILHWFGDQVDKNLDLPGYLRGFDGRRKNEDTYYNTSAHFLVGDDVPSTSAGSDNVGIVQTQIPYEDGTPLIASHLRGLSFGTHDDKKQYFVNAYYQLAIQDPTIHSLIQEMYDGRWIDPNQRTIAIEITGTDFNNHFPGPQKIANVLSVVWAIMKRYQITASSLLGHYEIQMNKGDPGKQFMALLRFLIGLKALIDPDPVMRMLVFGQLLDSAGEPLQSVKRYFDLVRNYHLLVSKPIQVFQWEALSKFWFIYPKIIHSPLNLFPAFSFVPPIVGDSIKNGYDFLVPSNHEGIDLHHPFSRSQNRPEKHAQVQLIADGQCLYLGEVRDCHAGKLAIFRHQQSDGAQILSVYGHLSEMSDIQAGRIYPIQTPIGLVANDSLECGRFLHFAIGLGPTWDVDLNKSPAIPHGAGPTWIRERYLEPIEYLKNRQVGLLGS